MSFKNYLKADFYKFYHSKIFIAHIIIPLLGLIALVPYLNYSSMNELKKIFYYFQVINIVFPTIISSVVTMIYEQEDEANKLKYFLEVPNNKLIPHLSKLILLILLGIMSTIIVILGFGIIFNILGYNALNLLDYLKQSLIIFGSNILIYIILYLVVFC